MSFSVLICTYNRHELLRKALHAIIKETVEEPDQVVIVNGGDKRTDQVVQAFVDTPGVEVKLVKTANKNLAASRNVGLAHCTGDIIAMTDDDAQVFPDWVSPMIRRLFDFFGFGFCQSNAAFSSCGGHVSGSTTS